MLSNFCEIEQETLTSRYHHPLHMIFMINNYVSIKGEQIETETRKLLGQLLGCKW